jgi:hypothetical protein
MMIFCALRMIFFLTLFFATSIHSVTATCVLQQKGRIETMATKKAAAKKPAKKAVKKATKKK